MMAAARLGRRLMVLPRPRPVPGSGWLGRRHGSSLPAVISTLNAWGFSRRDIDVVIEELKGNGISEAELPTIITAMDEDGVQTFLQSVRQQRQDVTRARFHLNFRSERDKEGFEVEAMEGESVRDLVKRGTTLASFIECSCDGIMACSTCHVVLSPALFGIVGPASPEEQDMLDLAKGLTDTSRLGCQLAVSREFEGETIVIPTECHDYFDGW
mmetsp:Transcript_23686/g.69322  ORF Transcript_23686/g.69322 Transcript_23686/m.69322 type:complete len:213 (-) Transcript_23686:95-733(-)